MLRARLFGPLAVEVDGREMPPVAGLRPRALLAWLLLHPGRHSRVRVASRFWPDVLDTSARASLRNALWTVRSALDAVGAAAYLDAGRESVGIAPDLPRDVDTEEFERLADSGDLDTLRRCFALAEQPLLADLADDWVLEQRDHYRERTAEVALRLAETEAAGGEPGAAAGWARRAVGIVPYRESAHRLLMRCLADAGELAEALAAHERCEALLAAELGTAPSEETRTLAARLRADARVPPRERLDRRTTGEVASSGPEPRRQPARIPPHQVPLFGRDGELKALVDAWDEARRGRGGVAVVSGAAGLGKSRVVEELAARALADGARYAAGTVYDLPAAPPYVPWSEALRELVAGTPPPPSDAVWPSDLARLCRAVERHWGRPASAAATDPERERSWLFEAVVEALTWGAHERPLLVVLEDVHLADRATIALLAYAGHQLAQLPALLVVTRRSGTARQDLALALDALARQGAIRTEISLGPLNRADIGRVVDTALPGLPAETRARVSAAAEGNPLVAREAARAAVGGEDLSQGLRTWLRAPLARLTPPARLLVDAVSVLGRPMGLGEAADLNGAEHLADAVAAAAHENLLEVQDRHVRFAHGLVREACYAELEPARRAWLHGRVADTLQARPGRTVAEVARHLLLSGREDEARGYLLTAAQQARTLGALDEAVAFLREAVEHAGDASESTAEAWLALADAEAGRGNRDEHDAAFNQAEALLWQSGDAAALASAYVVRGRCLRTNLCFPRESLDAYERVLEIVDGGGVDAPELRALALAGCAWIEAASRDAQRGRELVAQVEDLPEAAADPGLTAELELARGAALLRSRRFNEAEEASARAGQLARDAGLADIGDVGLIQASAAAAARGSFSQTLVYAERILRHRSSIGMRATALAVRAYGLSRLGRHDEAWAAAEQRLELLSRTGNAGLRATAQYDAGSIALAAGRDADAARLLDAALATGEARFPHALARLRLAEARLGTGDVASAAVELDRFPFEPVGPAELPEALVPQLERVQALVAAADGKRDLAGERFASAEAGWRRLVRDAPPEDPYATTLVAFGRSAPGGTVEPAVELGRTLAERAYLLAQDGALEQAGMLADEARALAEQLGYPGYQRTLRLVGELTGAEPTGDGRSLAEPELTGAGKDEE
ncbi:MAG TPA: AAA family ATPase [Jiangellaceae bacterium]